MNKRLYGSTNQINLTNQYKPNKGMSTRRGQAVMEYRKIASGSIWRKCQRPGCGKWIPAIKHAKAKYCSTPCAAMMNYRRQHPNAKPYKKYLTTQ